VAEPLQANAVYQWYNVVDEVYEYYEFNITDLAIFESIQPDVADFLGGATSMNVLSTLDFGSTTVRAEYMGVTSYNGANTDPYELDVEVTDKVVEYIVITAEVMTVVDPPNDEIHIPIDGFTVQLIITAYFSDDSEDIVTEDASWILNNASVGGSDLTGASINNTDEKGLFTSGTEAGAQIVTATYSWGDYGDPVSASITVYVDPGALQTLIIVDADGDSATTDLIAGFGNEYAALGLLAGSTTYYYIADRDVEFISTDIDVGVMDLDGDGLLSATDPGTTTVIVNHPASAVSDSVEVTVSDAIPVGISCRPGWVQRTPGDTVNYVVQVLMSNGEAPAILDGTVNAETLSFSSNNTPVADFLAGSPLGLATAGTTLGVATVTADWTDPGSGDPFSDTCDIEVVEELVIPGSCDLAQYIDPVAQTLYGSTENAGDNALESPAGEDVFYMFSLDEPATVDISVISPVDTWDIVPLVGSGCSEYDGEYSGPTSYYDTVDGDTGELICLPSGSYYIIIDGATADDWGAFEIDLDFEFGCVPDFEGTYVIDPAEG